MKRIGIFILVLISPLIVLAQYTETKSIDRDYTVSGKGSLSITGKYGDIHIDTWADKKVEVKVKIEAKKRSEALAKEILDKVKIVIDDNNKEALSFRTSIDGSINNRTGEELKIEYWVKAPATLAYNLKNSYGSLYLDDNEGENNLNIAYGNFKVDECNGKTELDASYSNGEVEKIANGNLDISYSNVTMGSIGSATVTSNYSNMDVSNISNLDLGNRYGNMKIGNVVALKGYSKYGGVTIQKLTKTLEFQLLHSGGLKIEWISKDFEKIDLEAKYGSLGLKFEKGFGANLDADMTYCELKYSGVPFDYTHLKEEAQHKIYKGILGDTKNAGNRIISITSSYGNAKISYAD